MMTTMMMTMTTMMMMSFTLLARITQFETMAACVCPFAPCEACGHPVIS